MEALRVRAARHAALSDISRLAIVDVLRAGDASPSELQELVGLPSNLLAHHLAVLQRVSLVRRRGSDADRRRSYVQLVRANLPHPLLDTWAWGDVKDVVFVCTANSARSQLAAALWNARLDVSDRGGAAATSAGTHPAERVDPRAVVAARRRGLVLRGRPAGLVAHAVERSLLVTVCDKAHEELVATTSPVAHRLHWSVPDPVSVGTEAAFEGAADELDARIRDFPARPRTPHDHAQKSHQDEGVPR